jgi:hypothetical protein
MRKVASSDDPDPQSAAWSGFAWSEWHELGIALRPRQSPVPVEPGIYRIRLRGSSRLIYIGQTGRSLRGRFGQLRASMRRAAEALDARAPHVAGACVFEHERRGGTVEVSWVPTPDLDKRERLGREVDLIAAYRRVAGESPACQFAGLPID